MKWISVEDELPPLQRKVLVCGERGTMRVSFRSDEYGPEEWDWKQWRITHWTELPRPAI